MKGAGYIAPAGFHTVMEKVTMDKKDRFRLRLDETPLVNYVRPSVDVTMTSVAELFGANTVGVILTGMGKDGVEGARKVKEKGGFVIAQDEATSVVYGMPKEAVRANVVDVVMGLSEIAGAVMKRLG